MTDTAAEEALAALARDLVEEISAGRAIELSEDPEALELAVFNVRGFQRTQRVKGKVVTETVHPHSATRAGGAGVPGAPAPGGGAGVPGAGQLQHPGNLGALGHPEAARISPGQDPHVLRSWISEPEWKKGQEEWKKKGAAAWKAHQKLHGDIKSTRDEISGKPISTGNAQEAWAHAHWQSKDDKGAGEHLSEAAQHLEHARSGGSQFPGEDLGKAYHSLHAAHRHGTEQVLPRATSKEARKGVQQHLDRIQQHMEDLDKLVGANPKHTKQLLAGTKEAGLKAGQRQGTLNAVADSISKTEYHIGSHMKGGYRPSLWAFGPEENGPGHLRQAQEALKFKQLGGDTSQVAEAYSHLSEAHRIGVERALAHAENPEDKQAVREGLDLIQQHMEDLDKLMGADPQRTKQLLGSTAEQGERAVVGKDRAEAEKNAIPNYLAPGRKVTDPELGWDGAVDIGTVTGIRPEHGGYLDIKWGDGKEGSYRLAQAKERLKPAKGEPPAEGTFPMPTASQTGMEGQLATAKSQALVGKRVTMHPDSDPKGSSWIGHVASKGGEGTVTEVPKEIWDMGAEEMSPNPGGEYVHVQWDNAPAGYAPVPVRAEDLKESVPEPPKGAAAVHPQLGGHLQRLPGETVSSRAYSHVPQPVAVPPPAVPSPEAKQLEQAGQRIEGYAQRAEQRRQADLSDHVSELRAREMAARGIAPPGQYAPLSDQEFAHHAQQLEETVDDALRAGQSTDQQFALDAAGKVWDPDRSMQHRDIIKDYLDKQVDVPSQRQAIMMGGLPGSGKSTMLERHPDVNPQDYATINTDHFKEELANRNMVPEVPGLSPLEASALVHEESAYLADLAAAELQKRGKNLIFDGTMRDLGIAQGRIKDLKKNRYTVNGMFVDVPVRTAAARAEARYRKGLEAYRKGANAMGSRSALGGRHVPRGIIMAGERGGPRDTFDKLRSEFSHWELHDNSTGHPVKVEESAPAARPGGTGIPSVEELQRQLKAGQYTGATEAEAQARERGTA